MQNFRVSSAVLVIACVALGLLGCAKKDLATIAVGKWSGSVQLPPELANNPALKSMPNALSTTMELKADKTWSGTLTMQSLEGTWSVEGEKVNLKISKWMGMDLDKAKQMIAQAKAANPALGKGADENSLDRPLVGTISDDGKTMSMNQPGATTDAKISLTKEAATS